MKKLMLALLIAAVVVPTVEAIYITTPLVRTRQYNLVALATGGNVAVSVLLVKGARLDVDDVVPLINVSGDFSIPRGVERIIFLVDASFGATGIFQVTQNGAILAEAQLGGGNPDSIRVVFDVQ